MATVTKTIGTVSQDYETITLWEADLDDTLLYSSGDDAVGEMYNDSAFAEGATVTINGGDTVGLNSILLTVASGERHDGTAGTGARWEVAGTFHLEITEDKVTIEWLEIDGNGNNPPQLILDARAGSERTPQNIYKWLILHDLTRAGAVRGLFINTGGGRVLNSIIYDMICTSTGSDVCHALQLGSASSQRITEQKNCTVYNTTNTGGSGNCHGILFGDHANASCVNCVSMETNGTTSGTVQDYRDAAPSNAVTNNNAASDTSASGTGSLDSLTDTAQFVSVTGGSEDFHIVDTDAGIFEAGADLGTTPTDVQFDADNYDRDTGGTTWSMGAFDGDELRIAPTGSPWYQYQQQQLLTGA